MILRAYGNQSPYRHAITTVKEFTLLFVLVGELYLGLLLDLTGEFLKINSGSWISTVRFGGAKIEMGCQDEKCIWLIREN